MGKSAEITLKINNFDRFNPRGDVKRPSWFRLDHGMVEDSDFFSFTDGEFKAWIYILSQASKKNAGGTIRLIYEHAERVCRIKRKTLDSVVVKLEQIKMVTVDVTSTLRARDVDVTDTNATYERTNVTNVTYETPQDHADVIVAELDDTLTRSLLEKVKPDIQRSWIALYGDTEFIKREIQQAAVWCKANSSRKPKSDFARFLTSWLAKGWEKHRKSIPTIPIRRSMAEVLGGGS